MADEQAKNFIDQATQSLQNGQFQQAIELLDQAIALEPNNSEAHVLRGVSLSQTNQPEAASDAFRQAITLSPYNAKAYYNLAVHLYSLGKKNEAMEMAREAASIDQKHAGARELMARIEDERNPQAPATPPGPSYSGDPLSGPPPGDSPEGGYVIQPPSQGPVPPRQESPPERPGQPQGAPPPPGQPYGQQPMYAPRSGYEAPAHHLPFVEKMGGGWRVLGWVLVLIGAFSAVAGLFVMGDLLSGFDPENLEAWVEQMTARQSGGPAQILLQMVSWGALLASFLYLVFDIMDRRGNWLWLLPFFLGCCCCSMHWIPLAIYLIVEKR